MMILIIGVKEAQRMGLENITLIDKTNQQITQILETQNEILVVQQAQADDYPPKKKLADREWCKDRICLKGLPDYQN